MKPVILLIDNNIETQNYLSEYFSTQNCYFYYSNTISDALLFWGENRVDIVFFSVSFPENEVKNAIENIRNINSSVIIVLLLPSKSHEYLSQIIHLKADEYIVKPLESEEFDIRIQLIKRRLCCDSDSDSVEYNWNNNSKLKQELIQKITEITPVFIYIYDIYEYKIVYCNRSLSEYLGFEKHYKNNDINEVFRSLMNAEDLSKFSRRVERWHNASDSDVNQTTYRFRNSSDSWQWFQGYNKVFQRNSDGKVSHILGSAIDITDMKHAVNMLIESSNLIDNIIENLPIGLHIFDENGISFRMNEANKKLFGYQSKTFGVGTFNIFDATKNLGCNMSDWFKNAYQGEPCINQDVIINFTNQVCSCEINQNSIYVNYSIIPIKDAHGNVKYVVTLANDITERKIVENELKDAIAKAEDANRAKSQFLANMSHEIRTPMNAILGFSDILYSQLTDQTQRNYLKSIKLSGTTLLEIINDILDLSKIEANRLEIKYEAINFNHLLYEIECIFSLKVLRKNIDYHTVIKNDFNRNIYFDALRLRQILLNLVSNAVKFTEFGYVHISANFEMPENQCNGDFTNLTLIVEDTGIGIPQSETDIIFEAFRQSDGHEARKYGGSGLGLAITKRLVEMLKGTIYVESQVGKGSRFIIHFQNVELVSEHDNSELINHSNNYNSDNQEYDDILFEPQLFENEKSDLRMLIHELETIFKEQYLTINQCNSINDISNFAQELENLAEKFELTYLQQYAQKLFIFTESFDLVNIKHQLAKYEQVVNRIKAKSEFTS